MQSMGVAEHAVQPPADGSELFDLSPDQRD